MTRCTGTLFLFTVIELASGEYGEDKIDILVAGTENGKSTSWFESYCPVKREKRMSEGKFKK